MFSYLNGEGDGGESDCDGDECFGWRSSSRESGAAKQCGQAVQTSSTVEQYGRAVRSNGTVERYGRTVRMSSTDDHDGYVALPDIWES